MAAVVLAKPDIALFSNIAGTRLVLDHVIVADLDEQWDSTTVWFDGGADGQLPVEYAGQGRRAALSCTARFVGRDTGHQACMNLIGLFESARGSADRRLQLRTNAGLVAGFDKAYVVTVSAWSRPRVAGLVYDVSFVAQQVHATVAV